MLLYGPYVEEVDEQQSRGESKLLLSLLNLGQIHDVGHRLHRVRMGQSACMGCMLMTSM